MQLLQTIKSKKVIAGIIGGVILLAGAAVILWFTVFSGEWIVKINGNKVNFQDFNDLYYAQARTFYDKSNSEIDKLASSGDRSPIPTKRRFLNQLIDHKFLYFKALDENYDSNKDVKILSEFQEYTIVLRYYLLTKFKDKVTVTDKEIADEYPKHKDQLKNVPIEEAESQIKNYLTQQKLDVEQKKKYAELEKAAQIDKKADLINSLSDKDKSKRPTSGTLVKISGKNVKTKEVNVEDFNAGYYAQLRFLLNVDNNEIDKLASDPAAVAANPILNKKEFLNQVIYQYLFYEAARSEGLLKEKDLIALSKFYTEQAVYLYFIKDKYGKDAAATEQEISEQYQRVKSQIPPTMLPDQAIMMIRSRIEEQKLQRKVEQLVSDLKDRWVIEKHMELLD